MCIRDRVNDPRRGQPIHELQRRIALRGVETPRHDDFACRSEVDFKHVFGFCSLPVCAAAANRCPLVRRVLGSARYAKFTDFAPAGDASAAARLARDVFGHRELIARADTLIADAIHQLAHEKYAITAYAALL